jgi:uncharacterized membrane protein
MADQTFWLLVTIAVMSVVAVIVLGFFAGEKVSGPSAGNLTGPGTPQPKGGLGETLFRVVFCDLLYFFFGPSCAIYGV